MCSNLSPLEFFLYRTGFGGRTTAVLTGVKVCKFVGFRYGGSSHESIGAGTCSMISLGESTSNRSFVYGIDSILSKISYKLYLNHINIILPPTGIFNEISLSDLLELIHFILSQYYVNHKNSP